jgi:hypothetical protein
MKHDRFPLSLTHCGLGLGLSILIGGSSGLGEYAIELGGWAL